MRRKRTRKKKGRRGQKGRWEAKENEEERTRIRRRGWGTGQRRKAFGPELQRAERFMRTLHWAATRYGSSRLRWAGCFWDIPGNSLAPGPLHPGSPQGWQMVPCDTSWKSGLFNQHWESSVFRKFLVRALLKCICQLGSGCLYYVDLKIYEHGMSVNLEEVFSFTHFIILQFHNYVSHKHIFVRYIPNYSILEVL